MANICICCQTNPANPMISPNFCSRVCQDLWLRSDLQFMSDEQMKRIALNALNNAESGQNAKRGIH